MTDVLVLDTGVASYLFKNSPRASCEDAGRPMAPSDAWIAAAAVRHKVPLLTNNLKHFEAAESLCGL